MYLSPGKVQHLWHLLETVRKWKIVLVPDAPFGLAWFAIPILVIWILFFWSNHFGNIALLQIAIILNWNRSLFCPQCRYRWIRTIPSRSIGTERYLAFQKALPWRQYFDVITGLSHQQAEHWIVKHPMWGSVGKLGLCNIGSPRNPGKTRPAGAPAAYMLCCGRY